MTKRKKGALVWQNQPGWPLENSPQGAPRVKTSPIFSADIILLSVLLISIKLFRQRTRKWNKSDLGIMPCMCPGHWNIPVHLRSEKVDLLHRHTQRPEVGCVPGDYLSDFSVALAV